MFYTNDFCKFCKPVSTLLFRVETKAAHPHPECWFHDMDLVSVLLGKDIVLRIFNICNSHAGSLKQSSVSLDHGGWAT